MKKIIVLLFILLNVFTVFSQKNRKHSTPPPAEFKLITAEDSLAYAIGVLNFKSINQDLIQRYNLQIDMGILTKGMIDFSKDTSLLDPQEANRFLGSYMTKKEGDMAAASAEAGKIFLEQNKSKPGVIITASGLQYEVVQMGTGKKPLPTDRVKVHYTGTLVDGTVFDSSVERGEPAVFVLNQVIPGWTEGLQLMPVGSKFRFYIPSELGYGARSAGPLIKPNSVLIFDVELLNIE